MQLVRQRVDDQIQFIIQDAPAKYHAAILGLAFAETQDGFVKSFPHSTPHLEAAFQRYTENLETILQQAVGEIAVPWQQAFERFLQRMYHIDVDWWLTGSAALALRGIPIQPKDIDLIVEGEGAVTWGEALADSMIEPVAVTDWFCKYWGRAFDLARIEWIGQVDPQSDFPYVQDYYLPSVNHLETVTWRGYEIRIPPVELQLKIEAQRGRLDRVKRIQAFLRDA